MIQIIFIKECCHKVELLFATYKSTEAVKPGSLGNIPPFGTPLAGVLKLLVGPRGGNPGGRCGGWPWCWGGRRPGKPKSGLGAKLGMKGAENAMVALQGDMTC